MLHAALWLPLSYSSPCRATSPDTFILPARVPQFSLGCFPETHPPPTNPLAPLPPDLTSPIDCDLTTIMHPPVGQLKLSYLPEWRGGNEKKKREEIMMPHLFVQSPASFEPAPLEVEEGTVLASLTVFQCHRQPRTRCPSAALSNTIKAACLSFCAGKFTHVDVAVLFQLPPPSRPPPHHPSPSLTGASATFTPTAVCMTKRS